MLTRYSIPSIIIKTVCTTYYLQTIKIGIKYLSLTRNLQLTTSSSTSLCVEVLRRGGMGSGELPIHEKTQHILKEKKRKIDLKREREIRTLSLRWVNTELSISIKTMCSIIVTRPFLNFLPCLGHLKG